MKTDPPAEEFTIRLTDTGQFGVPVWPRLRRLLKSIKRAYGFEATFVDGPREHPEKKEVSDER